MIKLAFLLTILLVTHSVTVTNPLTIFYVSGSATSEKKPVPLSYAGGTMLYIKVTGHSLDASQNLIYVDIYPCIIPSDGVTDTFISCETTSSGQTVDSGHLQITLISGSQSVTTSYPNTAYYHYWTTPLLVSVYPTAGIAGTMVNLWGYHRISDLGDGQKVLGDVVKLKVGFDICSTFFISQGPISPNSLQSIKCAQSPIQQANVYNVSQKLTPGYALLSPFITRSSLTPNNFFQYTVLPSINSLSVSSGNLGGQYLTITGNDFSPNPLNNSVSVDGTNCVITSASYSQIQCTVAPQAATSSKYSTTTNGTQQNGYPSGAGILYNRYTLSSNGLSISQLVTASRTNDAVTLGTVQESAIRADIAEGDFYGQFYAQTWKGYFTAPVNGTYTFRGIADDAFSVYLATVTGSTELPATPLISSSYAQVDSDFYYYYKPTAEASVTLAGGQSYYLQAYHINYGYTGTFRLVVDVPNSDTTLLNQHYQVDEISTNSTVIPEVIQYTVSVKTPGGSGSVQLSLYQYDSKGNPYVKSVNVTYGLTASQFVNALNQFQVFSSYQVSATSSILDANGLATTLNLSSSIVYTVSIYFYRDSTLTSQNFGVNYYGSVSSFTSSRVTSHSPLLGGYFTLSIAGTPIDPFNNNNQIPYNADAGTIQTYLRTIVGYENVQVDTQSPQGVGYSNRWIILYKGLNKPAYPITFSSSGLTGNNPTLAVNTLTAYSSSVTFDPIDYRFLTTPSSSGNVRVTVNNVPSVCVGTCSYSFVDYSKITSLSYSGTTLSLGLSDAQSKGFSLSAVSVSVGGLACTNLVGSVSSFSCTLPTNANGTANLVAGTVTPLVTINGLGIAELSSNPVVSPLTIPLVVSGLSLSSGGNNGGYVIGITGSGFPSDATQVSVFICSKKAAIQSITNQLINIIVPACSNSTSVVTVTVGSVTPDTSQTFNYVASTGPVIISLNTSSANPGAKGVLSINGYGFGTIKSAVKVSLVAVQPTTNPTYSLNVLSLNDSTALVGLPGGLAGSYVVYLNLQTNGSGDSMPATPGANSFSYAVTVSSVSPSTGSYNGGTLITITGTNFVTDIAETNVYIGVLLNWFCNIESITSTIIQCRTPPISTYYTTNDANTVTVSTRLVVLNKCTGTCTFQYKTNDTSPYLSTVSTTAIAGGNNLTLTGLRFTNPDGTAQVSFYNNDTTDITVVSVNATVASATSITVLVPTTLVSGIYLVKVRNLIGQTNPINVNVSWNVGTASFPNQGSAAGGVFSFTNGLGYPIDLTNTAFSVSLSAIVNNVVTPYPVSVVSCCSGNSISLVLPATAFNTKLTITFTGPVNTVTKQFTSATYYTSTATLSSAGTVSAGLISVTLNVTKKSPSSTIQSVSVLSAINSSFSVPVPTWTFDSTKTFVSFSVTLPPGNYKFQVSSADGYYLIMSLLNVSFPSGIVNTAQSTSYAGGSYTLSGGYLSPASYIVVNGFKGYPISNSTTSITYAVPPLITAASQASYKLASVSLIDLSPYTYISDRNTTSNASFAFDGVFTTIYGSANTPCWLGVDAGTNLQISASRIRFYPYLAWTNAAAKLLSTQFQGSNDGITWINLATIDQTVHSGFNTILSQDTTPYRYIRFLDSVGTSQCNLAEFQIYGVVSTTLNNVSPLTTSPSDVTYYDGLNTQTFTNDIIYDPSATPVITSISPKFGDIFGNYDITFTGTNLNLGTVVVTIDGIPCVYKSSTSTQIICTAGARPSIPKANSLTVTVNGGNAIIQDTFDYVYRWSAASTWGVSLAPGDGDVVSIPKGMTLLVDQTTPALEAIIAQNATLLFSDEGDFTVTAGYILVNGGRFIAGTEAHPYSHKLTFVLTGNLYGKQMPMFGNKGIMCNECFLSLFGTPRHPTWTYISQTINPSQNWFVVSQDVDWNTDDVIVVASTSFFHTEAERRKIVSVNGRNITVNESFVNKHVAVSDKYGSSDYLNMVAEVGLLTRNIKVTGDDTSALGQYGAHLMIAGKSVNGAEGHVAYSEFTNCGQPGILGRYCIHFHMNGEIPTSYVRGNAVHDSFARVVTIHGVYYLIVELNVGYNVHGHNFFVQDGIETKNVIRYNLAISSFQSTKMLQTDTSVASFWVTNPTNDFYGNNAAGSDFYGIWYEIKANPDGPSATNDVCPMGNPLGNVYNNTAHSNLRFGLRIFKQFARKYPCSPVRNDSNPYDPWADNPSSPSTYSNFTLYKNLQNGILAEQTGNVFFDRFAIGQNYLSGAEFWLGNFTKVAPGVTNSFIVGQSNGNPAPTNVVNNYTNGKMTALFSGRTGTFTFSNINIYNYPQGSIALSIGRLNDDPDHYTNLGAEITISGLKFTNVSGVTWLKQIGTLKRNVIYDTDGSLSSSFDGTQRVGGGAILYNFPHIAQNPACLAPTDSTLWDNAVYCDSTVAVRRVVFANLLIKQNFKSQKIHAQQIDNITDFVPANSTNDTYTSATSFDPTLHMEPEVEYPSAYGLPFIAGSIYQIWWGSGIDFEHLSVFTTPIYAQNDPGIIFVFNFTEGREKFNVGPMRAGALLTKNNYVVADNTSFLPTSVKTCNNSEYFFQNGTTLNSSNVTNTNVTDRYFALCQSGKNRAPFEFTEVNPVICEFDCPVAGGYAQWDGLTRKWSNASNWPGQVLPAAGADVNIPATWHMIIDISPNAIGYLTIDGLLYADDSKDINLTAASILIRYGNLTVGSPNSAFIHNFNIILTGHKGDFGYTVDPMFAGNKFLVVAGSLNLYGQAPSTVITYLTSTAYKGDSVINVNDATGWAVGDTLVLGPSFSDYSQYEQVTISSISSNQITLTSKLSYTHYGDSAITLNITNVGQLDTRTRVGHINRNIQILAGDDVNYGYTVMVYGYLDGKNHLLGAANIKGVHFVNGGQLDSMNSALVFQNVKVNASTVTASSFTDCQANCIYALNAQNVSITNNVLYHAWVFGLQVSQIKSFNFQNNLIIGVTERPTLNPGGELVACISAIEYANPQTDNIVIQNNFCQGSQAHGYAFSHILCGQEQVNPYQKNTVGSATIGFILQKADLSSCQSFSYAYAYACRIGQINGPNGKMSLNFSNFVMADNGRGITMKLGAAEGGYNHTGFLYNSYITAVSRPNCAYCYGSSATSCSNSIGVRMFVASANGQSMPNKFGAGFDVICKQQVYDLRAYIFNVVFDGFQQTYSGAVNGLCSNNFVFHQHDGAHDSTADHNLYNVKCQNCDTHSYLKALNPNLAFLGWFGGCGDIVCTGVSNYLVHDFNGTFLGKKAVLIPNNSVIGMNEPSCTYDSYMNAYLCTDQSFATLQYQNIDADAQKRIMWPVNLTSDTANYTTITNGWREWDWMGKQPQNARFGRFVSVIKLNNTYNMTYNSKAPLKLQLKIRERSLAGTPRNFLVIKLFYPLPNMIQVQIGSNVINPILQTDYASNSGIQTGLNTSQCGSNIYFYSNYTTHFVITQDPACLVVVSLSETLQLTTHFSMDIKQFFSDKSRVTTFINNVCALLNITDTSRVKVVGVYSGSTIVTAVILPPTASSPPSDPSVSAASATLSGAISSGSAYSAFPTIGTVTTMTYQYIPAPGASSSSSSSSSVNIGLIIGVSLAGFVLLVGIFITMIYCIRKRAKVVEEIRSSEEEFHQQKEPKVIDENSSELHVPHYSNFKINQDKELKVENFD